VTRVENIAGGWRRLRPEFRPMLHLAIPVVMSELGWMAMGVVDTIMVGRLGAEAIGAVSIGSILFHVAAIFGVGLLLGLDTLVSQAFGRGDLHDCHHSLLQAVYLCAALAPPLMLFVILGIPFLRDWGLHPKVLEFAAPYMQTLAWSTLPLFLYTAFRRYLQGMSIVRPAMIVLLSANIVNVIANWMLIFGKSGFPAMGVEGAGWATCISRIYMALALLIYIVYHDARHRSGLRLIDAKLDLARIGILSRLGLPAAAQILLEVGVFAAATAIIGRLDPVALAAHQVALNVASVTFMVPLGISSAAAVRVGQALGRRDPPAARRAGWTGLFLAAAFMSLSAIVLVSAPRLILRIYTTDTTVIATGVSLLFIAAVFQLFDGIQVVATGALRGAGDTRRPMLLNLVAHWAIGLPIGYYLCFSIGWGVQGIWSGLCIGLIGVALALLVVWARAVGSLAPEPARAAGVSLEN
jgi:MATE family multidrug resistance protein